MFNQNMIRITPSVDQNHWWKSLDTASIYLYQLTKFNNDAQSLFSANKLGEAV